jgi:hypothetical protein
MHLGGMVNSNIRFSCFSFGGDFFCAEMRVLFTHTVEEAHRENQDDDRDRVVCAPLTSLLESGMYDSRSCATHGCLFVLSIRTKSPAVRFANNPAFLRPRLAFLFWLILANNCLAAYRCL